MTADGKTIQFLTKGGVGVMRYGQLHARDAEGKDLPASMGLIELSDPSDNPPPSCIIRISVNTEGAAYPITIDPLATATDWTAESNQAGAYFGESVSTAGDVNGDGYDDVIVGARLYDNGQTDEGRVFVYHGSASGLSSSPAWMAESNQANSGYGVSVSTAGDVNGDGYDDVIVGAYLYDNGQTDEGRAYVYHGSPSGLPSTANWTAESNQSIGGYQCWFGYSVSTAGDVNGDGYDDVIVGAPSYTTDVFQGGQAFVWYGSASGLGASGTPANADWASEPTQSLHFGMSVSTAGDVNGDGYDDIIAGAPYYGVGTLEDSEGRACVYYGSASGLSPTMVWSAESNYISAYFGDIVAMAGDVNGDGYDDILVGAPAYNVYDTPCDGIRGGAAFVWYGSASGLGPDGTPDNADWSIENTYSISLSSAGDVNGDGYSDVIIDRHIYHGSATGLSSIPWVAVLDRSKDSLYLPTVSTAGDVNGDGFSDVIFGLYDDSNGEVHEGRAVVFHGSDSGMTPAIAWMEQSNQAGAEFGRSVSTGGDINGDGYGDVIVAAPLYDNGETDEGMVFVYHGSSSGLSPTFDWMAESNQAGAEFGCSVAAAGDVNGDGYGDIIVGAHLYDNGETDEGGAFVWLGSASGLGPDGTPANADWSAESDQAGAGFGCSVATAGDVNGDGYDDIIVGARHFDNPEVDEGRVFVYHGSASGLSSTANWTAEGDQETLSLGVSVAAAGDANGDGYGDVIVGVAHYGVGGERAFAWYGSSSGLGANGTPANADWGASIGEYWSDFGSSVATAGDVNGDGYSDAIVGEPRYSNGQYSEGGVFVYLGSSSGLSASPAWNAEGNQEYAVFGFSVSTAGDANGDGYSDIIVGSRGYDDPSGWGNHGRAYLYLGSPSGLSFPPVWTGEEELSQIEAQFGWSVSTAGDVNGDGYDDFIVGAPYYDYSECEEGRAFLYYGSPAPTPPSAVLEWSLYE